MSRTITGEAKRLSVGMSKKPWIWQGVQVERHDAVDAGLRDQVGHELGRDRRARAGFAILPGIAEIGDHGGDAARRRPAQRVGDDQQLHQMVVGRKRGRLDDEGIRAADVFLDFDENLHVGEAPDHGLGQRQVEPIGDGLRQRRVGIAGNQLDGAVLGRHRGFSPGLAGDNVQHIGFPCRTGTFDEGGNIRRTARLATHWAGFPGQNGCNYAGFD